MFSYRANQIIVYYFSLRIYVIYCHIFIPCTVHSNYHVFECQTRSTYPCQVSGSTKKVLSLVHKTIIRLCRFMPLITLIKDNQSVLIVLIYKVIFFLVHLFLHCTRRSLSLVSQSGTAYSRYHLLLALLARVALCVHENFPKKKKVCLNRL